ncbi:DUF2690 domain-containing protein [Leucobacter sp. HY1910]
MSNSTAPQSGANLGEPVDTVEAFAEGLRDLKTAAGNPTLAAISNQTGVSKSVISVALSGKSLPTENTVLKLVGLFGGDPKTWRSRRNALAPRSTVLDPAPESMDRSRRFSLLQTTLIAAVAAVLGVLGTVVTMNGFGASEPALAEGGRHLSEPANGIDPMLTSCRDDAVIAASEARLDNQVHVQLMYSNDCMAVWGRVTRYDGETDGNTMSMRVWPLDDPQSTRAQSRTDIGLQSLYTPMIIEPDTAARICGLATIMVDGKTEELGPQLCI